MIGWGFMETWKNLHEFVPPSRIEGAIEQPTIAIEHCALAVKWGDWCKTTLKTPPTAITYKFHAHSDVRRHETFRQFPDEFLGAEETGTKHESRL